MDINTEVMKRKDDLVKDLSNWIKTKGVLDETSVSKDAPFGKDVKASLDYIYNLAKKDGFEVRNCDGYAVEIIYGSGKENVTVLAHADVVPEGKNWIHKPFGGTVENNLVYGRGSSDDKGPGLAAYYALKIIKENKVPLKRKIRFVFGGNEENGSKCLDYYFNTLKKEAPTYGFTPDADFPLIYGEKGIMSYEYFGEYEDNVIKYLDGGLVANAVPEECEIILKGKLDKLQSQVAKFTKHKSYTATVNVKKDETILKIKGKAAHAATPEEGINAVAKGLEIVAKFTDSKLAKHFAKKFSDYYGKHLNIATYSFEFKKLTMNLGIGKYDGKKYSFIINIRYPNNETALALAKVLKESKFHNCKMLSYSEPLYVNPKSKFVKVLLDAYKEVTHDKFAKPITIGGGTYARETINSVAFGMDFKRNNGSGNIHSIEEAINIDDLVDGTKIYTKALIKLGNL